MVRLSYLWFLFVAISTHAEFAHFETSPVPADRVLTNLTIRLASKTNDFELLHIIARLHSLSYARSANDWVVNVYTKARSRPDISGLPELEHAGYPPKNVVPPTTPARSVAAKTNLEAAIQYYKRAIAANPTNEIVQIGLGWRQIQAGQTNAAKETLRQAVKMAWAKEKKASSTMWATTKEAISYLRPLLDLKKDKKEIDELTRINEQAFKLQRLVTPLILAIQPGLTISELIDTNASVAFDLDGSGIPNRKWEWITTNAAWIVYLPQGGPVTSALQMFGNVTFWMFWENGYHALASLDDNGDGIISGDELRGIQLWQDRNCDGRCTPDEIIQLSELGITALDTRYTSESGIPTSRSGAQFTDNGTRSTYDVILGRRFERSE
jgi:hypothetical protein